jgi:hypothetical protein
MVGASDVDSSSVYSTSSLTSSEDEGELLTRDGFCTMALSSGSKKSHQRYSNSNSEDEVRDELPFLR